MIKISSNESSRSFAISWKTRRHFCRWLYHGQISRALSRTFTVIGRIRGCPLFFLPFVRPISDVSIGERARRKGERARSRTVGWKAVQEEAVQEEEEEEEWVDGRGGGEGGGGCFGSGVVARVEAARAENSTPCGSESNGSRLRMETSGMDKLRSEAKRLSPWLMHNSGIVTGEDIANLASMKIRSDLSATPEWLVRRTSSEFNTFAQRAATVPCEIASEPIAGSL